MRKTLVLDIIQDDINLLGFEKEELKKALFSNCNIKDSLTLEELIYMTTVKKKPLYISKIKNQTDEISKEAVRNFGRAIAYIEKQTKEIALTAVSQDGLALKHVDKNLHCNKVVSRAINQNPLAFEFSDNKEYDICLEAVKLNGVNLAFVPDEYKDEKMIITALSSNGWALKFIEEQTEKYALEAVLQNTEVSLQVEESIRENNPLIKGLYEEHIKRLPFVY